MERREESAHWPHRAAGEFLGTALLVPCPRAHDAVFSLASFWEPQSVGCVNGTEGCNCGQAVFWFSQARTPPPLPPPPTPDAPTPRQHHHAPPPPCHRFLVPCPHAQLIPRARAVRAARPAARPVTAMARASPTGTTVRVLRTYRFKINSHVARGAQGSVVARRPSRWLKWAGFSSPLRPPL